MRKHLDKKHLNYRRSITIPVLDLTTLLYNIHMGAKEKNIGWEDAALTLNDISVHLDFNCHMDPNDVESALWSCNLRDEKKKFWDVKGRTFDEFLRSVVPDYKFSKDYNFITKKEIKHA